MIKPSWSFADVFALNALQKSMMLTPCWPSAGPTGGAGVAFPAGICSFTKPITFFAIAHLPRPAPFACGRGAIGWPAQHAPGLGLLDLQEIQLDRGGPA